jgi:hypothetical protein
MTVGEVKWKISEMLQDLQKQGIWVREINVAWTTEVSGEDKKVLDHSISAKVTLSADL